MAIVGLTVDSSSRLILNGKRFCNIGVKWPTAIVNFFDQPASNTAGTCVYTSSATQDAGIAYLKSLGVKVVLVSAFPFYPYQWTSGVLNGKAWNVANASDRLLHYNYVDAFLAKLKAAGIGAILTMFFRWPTLPDLTANNCRQWLSGGSNTRTFATTITQEIVTRYTAGARSDLAEAVYGWQFSGEINHANDISSASIVAGTSLFSINTAYGTASGYTRANDALLTGGQYDFSELATVLSWWDGVVSAIDPTRIRLSGNGSNAYWQPGGTAGISNPIALLTAEFLRDNPHNATQIHFYGGIGYCSYSGTGFDALLGAFRSAAKSVGKPLILGEFGNQPRTVSSLAVSSGIATCTIGGTNWAAEVGDFVRLYGTGGYDGEYVITALPSGQNGSATLQARFAVKNGSSSAGSVQQAVSQFSKRVQDVIKAGVDLAFVWNYNADTNAPLLEKIDAATNDFEPSVIKSANQIMSSFV